MRRWRPFFPESTLNSNLILLIRITEVNEPGTDEPLNSNLILLILKTGQLHQQPE